MWWSGVWSVFRCLVNEERCSLNAVQLKYSPLFFSALHCMYYWCILLINCSGGGGVQLLFSWLPSLLMDRERSLDVFCVRKQTRGEGDVAIVFAIHMLYILHFANCAPCPILPLSFCLLLFISERGLAH